MTAPTEKAAPIPAERLAFGDAVTNIAASDENPIKHGWFIRRGKRSGRVNAGSFFEYATADGRLHQTPPDNIAPRDAEPVFRADRASQEERHTPDCRANVGERERRMVVLMRDESGKPTVWCDPCIAPLVKALNDAGIRTVASCCGHSHRPGSIALADGRWLVIGRDEVEWRRIEALFPVDINGEDRSQEERIREDVARLDWLEANSNVHVQYEGWEEDVWEVYRVNGGRSDREWSKIAESSSLRDAIDRARLRGDAS